MSRDGAWGWLCASLCVCACFDVRAGEFPAIGERQFNPYWRVHVPAEVQDDHFGFALAIDGSAAVVGMPNRDHDNGSANSGFAWMLQREGERWRLSTQIVPFGGGVIDQFGQAVALHGDTLVVSSVNMVFVYVRSEGVWAPQARLQLPFEPEGSEAFGHAVAVSGDVIAVGAPGVFHCDFLPCAQPGLVFVFRRVDGAWLPDDPFTSTNIWTAHGFGSSLAINGDWLVVGQPYGSNGAVYAFPREAGAWGAPQVLEPDVRESGMVFGGAVALADDLIVVGAPGNDYMPGAAVSGSAHVFRLLGNQWIGDGKMSAPTPADLNEFGSAVAIHDGRIAIAGDNDAGVGSIGVYEKQATSWIELGRVSPAPAGPPEFDFGWSVALGQDTMLVGNPFDQDPQQTLQHAGAIYAYRPGQFASSFEGVE